MTAPRVVVIGAGLAGLAAAWRLRERGLQVRVLERGERLGGRAGSDQREGFWFDAGAQWVGPRDGQLLGLVEAAGVAQRLLPLRPSSDLQLRNGVAEPIDTTRWVGIARIPGLRPWQALRLQRLGRLERKFEALFDEGAPERAARLDDRSIGDFVRLYFGSTVLERWAGPFTAGWTLAEEGAASRLLFLRTWLARRGSTASAFRAGLGVLTEALAGPLEVALGVTAEAVEASSEGLVVRMASPHDDTEADAVVLATRAPAVGVLAGPLLVQAERDVLDEVRYASSIVLGLGLERAPTASPVRLRIPHAERWPVEVVSVDPRHGAEGGPVATLVARDRWSRVHLDAPDDALVKDLLAVLERLHPGVGSAVRLVDLRRHRQAVPRFEPGRYHALARLRRVQTSLRSQGRRLYLAGDYLADPSLEGAVVSGLRAAQEVCVDLGR